MRERSTAIDKYLARLPEGQRGALEDLRSTIASAVPDTEEAIRSGVPAIRYRGKTVVGFSAAKRHLSLYVMQGSALRRLRAELEHLDTSHTVVRFTPERPLPESLVKRIVEIRLAEIDGRLP